VTAFYLDDIPAEPVTIDPATVDVSAFTTATASVIDPAGDHHDATAEIVDGGVDVIIPDVLTLEGVYRIRVILTGTGTRASLPDERFIVQDNDSEWNTLDTVRVDWPDAESIEDVTLWAILEIVRQQVAEFGTTLTGTAALDATNYAQRLQARNTWNAAKVSPAGDVGTEDFVIRPFPLDWHVKQVLRPQRGVPVVA
jgi:hypothetical protein